MDKPKTSRFFIGSLFIFFILFLIIQAILASALNLGKQTVAPETQLKSSETIGQIGANTSAVIDVKVLSPGEQVVKQVCSRCHRSGLMKSPELGNKQDWAPRIEKGVDKLYHSALNGFNKMPARGGRKSLSDEKVMAAVDHMLSLVK